MSRDRNEPDQPSNTFELGALIRRLSARGVPDCEIARGLHVGREQLQTARADAGKSLAVRPPNSSAAVNCAPRQ